MYRNILVLDNIQVLIDEKKRTLKTFYPEQPFKPKELFSSGAYVKYHIKVYMHRTKIRVCVV